MLYPLMWELKQKTKPEKMLEQVIELMCRVSVAEDRKLSNKTGLGGKKKAKRSLECKALHKQITEKEE